MCKALKSWEFAYESHSCLSHLIYFSLVITSCLFSGLLFLSLIIKVYLDRSIRRGFNEILILEISVLIPVCTSGTDSFGLPAEDRLRESCSTVPWKCIHYTGTDLPSQSRSSAIWTLWEWRVNECLDDWKILNYCAEWCLYYNFTQSKFTDSTF